MMGDRNGNTNSGASGSMLSLLAGAALGAAGLGWWLLAEAEQRRQRRFLLLLPSLHQQHQYRSELDQK